MKLTAAAALTLAGSLALAGAASADHYLQAEPKSFALEGARSVKIDFSVGEMRVEGDDGETVRVLVRVHCKSGSYADCSERARKIVIDEHVGGGAMTIGFEGVPKNHSRGMNVEVRLLVPRTLATHAEMGVGRLEMTGLAGNIDVNLGVGDLDLRAEQRDFRSVNASAGVGDATVDARGGRTRGVGFVGHTANWDEGQGRSEITAKVGVGKVAVRLQ